jgi:hypothetical protein
VRHHAGCATGKNFLIALVDLPPRYDSRACPARQSRLVRAQREKAVFAPRQRGCRLVTPTPQLAILVVSRKSILASSGCKDRNASSFSIVDIFHIACFKLLASGLFARSPADERSAGHNLENDT